jgi:RHS repeat-associated protein
VPQSDQEKQDPARSTNGAASLAPSISLPKGGGAIRGIGEKFAANPVTGTGSMSVPIATSPGRSGFGPQLSLAYDSGAGNGPFGFGWSLSIPAITRKTDKGLPLYRDAEESDVYLLSGAEDLVPVLQPDGSRFADDTTLPGFTIHRYRPRVEGLFARIERWTDQATGDIHWRSITRDNVTTLYGKTEESRIADPSQFGRVFTWLICQSYDDKGNAIVYQYAAEGDESVDRTQANECNRVRTANRYLKRVRYGNRTPNRDLNTWAATDPALLPDAGWMFEVVFDYGEGHYTEESPDLEHRVFAHAQLNPPLNSHWPVRQDPFSSYRAGFEVRTYRLCRRVLMFHHFPQELGTPDCLVRATEFTYTQSPIASFITAVTQSGYKRGDDGTYLKKSLPPLEYEYSQVPTPGQLARQPVQEVDAQSLENLPMGLDGAAYEWVDLDGEGTSGILTEQADGWYYKRNLSANNQVPEDGHERTVAHFSPTEIVASKPTGGLAGGAQFLDLAGDGQVDLVRMEGPLRGFYERTDDAGWAPFQPFASWPNLNTRDPDLKFVDLTGDGHADILITEGDALTWYPSLAEDGFGAALRLSLQLDEEQGPRLVFADDNQREAIYLADLSGDGLSDLVRIRNGEVCYWPNLGYGRFGSKVTMDGAPWFDRPDQFDPRRIRLADTDGSGTTDILYLRRDGVQIYFNQSGNRWSDAVALPQFPAADNISSVQALDLLGNGTACLVWSSPLPANVRRPMHYIALMDEKPHLLVGVKNNLGAETIVHFAPSTRFYLDDKRDGTPWITRLPFPVHVVERVETFDYISRNRFVTRYAYHHGYFDGEEREFRGFGMVEQFDTEEFATLSASNTFPSGDNIDAASHMPPVLTKRWFHTGLYVGRDHVSDFFAGLLDQQDRGEYYREPGLNDAQARALLLPDTVLPDGLTVEEEREACRALKGAMLRQEVYAWDGTDKADHPYTVAEQNFTIRMLQPRGDNRHAVFFTHPREAITYHYERNPQDPRIQHALTLEVDKYGNVLKEAAIGYGRRQSLLAEPRDQAKQTTTLITYTENDITNPIDDPTLPNDYRAPLPAEMRTYELTGYPSTGATDRYQHIDFVRVDPNDSSRLTHIFDGELVYEESPPNGKQRRLIKHIRTVYRQDDLTALLPLGELEPLALPGESYKLALTAGLLAHVFVRRRADGTEEPLLPVPVAPLLEGQGADQGGYAAQDGNWWIPSGRTFYSRNAADTPAEELAEARTHFFLLRRYRDPFAHDTTVDYDGPADPALPRYDLLVTRTEDAVQNVVSAENDYRVLGPRRMTDPNRNRTEVAFDALGMVAGTAVMGKPLPAPVEGDSLALFKTDLTQAEIDAFYDAPDPHAPATGVLQNAATRIVYDLDRFQRTRQAHPKDPTQWLPVYAATLARETHVSDPLPPQGLRIQIGFSYSDGFGREIQKKVQAEPGPLVEGGPVVSPRWVGSGWTIFNNKGKPVRQYEPFFSQLAEKRHQFEFGVKIGVSPVLFYDPIGRAVATLHPNHTYEKVLFDPWQQTTYDVNDTVAPNASGTQTGDPRTDPELAGYVSAYFKTQPATWQTWHTQRIGNPAGDPERDAALKAAAHTDTPTAAHLDTLGRPFLTIAHNRFERNGIIIEGKPSTRVELDIEGNQREVIDAMDRIVMRYDYDLLGNVIHQTSMEAGERWTLGDVTGKPIRAWDSRRFLRRMTYDELHRPTGLYVTENGAERLAERTVYGESQGDTRNHRTRIYQVFDGAGVISSEGYDFKGNLLESTRKLLPGYKQAVNWLQNPDPTDGSFTSRTVYDALNRPLSVTAPDGSVYRPTFNEANLLDKVEVNLRGAATATPFVTNIDYNAKGQRTLIHYGNGTQTTYDYDPLTFRLTRLKTTRPAGLNGLAPIFVDPTVVQDLRYTYDPAGNITRIHDGALKTISHNQQSVEPICEYTYDALYCLIEAKGREHIGQTAHDFNPPEGNRRDYPFLGLHAHPNDPQAMRNYTERYEYDAVGNFENIRHSATGGSWTRRYDYAEASLTEPGNKSNRLTKTTVGNGFSFVETYTYTDAQGNDVHGCMTAINGMKMAWDFEDRFQQVDLGGGGTAYYVYDAAGQRVRKVIERNGATVEERIHLGRYEVYRKRQGGAPQLERQTLHVMDDKQRIALVETRTLDMAGNDPAPPQLIRYQLGNHLGSASLELDHQAQIISYEEYTPYGSTSYQAVRSQTETPKRYRYTGKERDEETGFTYHGARYYAPWLGRWTSCDPLLTAMMSNRYSYAKCHPVNFFDPDGHDPQPDPFNLFGQSSKSKAPNPLRLGFDPQSGELDIRYFPPPAIHNREDIEKIRSTSPERVLGRFALSTIAGLLGEGTASGPASAQVAERDRRLYPGVGYGEQALNIALAMLPVEKILGYAFKGVRSLLATEAKGAATTAEKAFLTEISEDFKAIGTSADKSVAANLARGNFGERMATDTLASEGHRIVSYKPNISGTNQPGIDMVTIKDGVVYFVDNKALTRSGNVSSVSALTTNFAKNKDAVLKEIRALLGTNISQEERQVLEQSVESIVSGNYKKVVTNANLTHGEKFLTGVTEELKSKGIDFKDVYATH